MQTGDARLHRGERRGILAGHEGADVVVAERRIVVETEQMRRHGAGQMGEGGHVLECRGDLGGAAKTMAHHAGVPTSRMRAR